MYITRAILLLCLGCLLCVAQELSGFNYSSSVSPLATSTQTSIQVVFHISTSLNGQGGTICYNFAPGWVASSPKCHLTSDSSKDVPAIAQSTGCALQINFAVGSQLGGGEVPVDITCTGFYSPRFVPIDDDGSTLEFASPGSVRVSIGTSEALTAFSESWPSITPQTPDPTTIVLSEGAQWAHMVGASPSFVVSASPLFQPATMEQAIFRENEKAFIEVSIPASAVADKVACTTTPNALKAGPASAVLADNIAYLRIPITEFSTNVGSAHTVTISCPAGTITLPTEPQAVSNAIVSLLRPPSASADDDNTGETPVLAAIADAASLAVVEFPAIIPRTASDILVEYTSNARVGRFGPVTISFITPAALKSKASSGHTLRIGLPKAFSFSRGLQRPARCEQGTDMPLQLVSTDADAGTATFYLHSDVKEWTRVSIRCTGVSYPMAPFVEDPQGASVEFLGIGNTVVVAVGRGSVPAVSGLPANSLGSTTATMTLSKNTADTASEFTMVLSPISGRDDVTLSSVAPLTARLPVDSRPTNGATCPGAVKTEGKPDVTVSFKVSYEDGDEFVSVYPEGVTELAKGSGITFSCPVHLPLNPRVALRDVVWSYGSVVPLAVLFPAVADVPNKLFFTPRYTGDESTMTVVLDAEMSAINADQVIAISVPLPVVGRGVFLTGSAIVCEVQSSSGTPLATFKDPTADRHPELSNSLVRVRITPTEAVPAGSNIVCRGLSYGSGLVLGGPQRLPVRVYSTWPPIDDGQGNADGQGKLMVDSWVRFDPASSRPSVVSPNGITFASRSAGHSSAFTLRMAAFTFPLTPIHQFDLSLPSVLVSPTGKDSGVTCEFGATNSTGQINMVSNVRSTVSSALDPTGLTRTWTITITSGNVVAPSNKVDFVVICQNLRNPDAQQALTTGKLSLFVMETEENSEGATVVKQRGLVSEVTITPASIQPSELIIGVGPTTTVPNSASDLVFVVEEVPVPLYEGDTVTLTLPPSHLFTLDSDGKTSCGLIVPDTSEGADDDAVTALPLANGALAAVDVSGVTMLRLTLTATADMAAAVPRGADIIVSCSNVLNPGATDAGAVSARWVSASGVARASEEDGVIAAIEYPIPGSVRAELLPETSVVGGTNVSLTLVLSPIPVASPAGTRLFIEMPAPVAGGWLVPALTSAGDGGACVGSMGSFDPSAADIKGMTKVDGATNELEFVFEKELPLSEDGTFRLFCKGFTLPTSPTAAQTVAVRFVAPAPSTLITMLAPAVPLPAITAASTPVARGVVLIPLSFPTSTTLISYQIDGIVNAFTMNKDLKKLRIAAAPHRQYIESGAAVLVVALRSLSPWIHADDLRDLSAPFIPDIAASINAANIGLRAVPLTSPLQTATLPARCFNGAKDADEADVDCGGESPCGRCGFNKQCARVTDCVVSACAEPISGGGKVCPWVGAKFPNSAPSAAAGVGHWAVVVAAAIAAVMAFAG